MTFTHTCLFFYLAEVPALPVVLKNRIWKKIYSELKNWNFEEKMPLLPPGRDVNVLIFLDFSFRYDSVHQKY